MADWSAVGDFEKAAKPGDLVDEEIVEEFVNCLPPTTLRGDLVQAGEPYSHQYDPEADLLRQVLRRQDQGAQGAPQSVKSGCNRYQTKGDN